MNNVIKKLFLGLLLLISVPLFAQQDSQYTHYMYNTIAVNPAYAGSRNVLSAVLMHRTQWQGIQGAPKTQLLSINSPLNYNVGIGASVLRDEIGPATETQFAVDYSYTLALNNKDTKLAFGLKGGLNSLTVDFTKLLIYDPTDVSFQENISGRLSPIVGVGTYLYNERWYLGVSVPNLLKTKHYNHTSISTAKESAHLNIIGGYVFNLSENVQYKPAFLVKAVKGSPIALDFSSSFLIGEKLILGASYRLDAAVSAMVGIQASRKFMFGYAYDYDTTDIGNYNSGSHEFLLRFELFTKVKGKVSPRFF